MNHVGFAIRNNTTVIIFFTNISLNCNHKDACSESVTCICASLEVPGSCLGGVTSSMSGGAANCCGAENGECSNDVISNLGSKI
jgi:hypothetical protein